MITAERIRALLQYDPKTGRITWAVDVGHNGRIKAGTRAGWHDDDGYLLIRVEGTLYQGHRLIWLHQTGEWPKGVVDHRNLKPSDNRWENLRDVRKRVNQENRHRAGKNNKSGLLGVSPNGNRWSATINTSEGGVRKHHYLGTFDTPEQAHQVYVDAKRRLHEGCTL